MPVRLTVVVTMMLPRLGNSGSSGEEWPGRTQPGRASALGPHLFHPPSVPPSQICTSPSRTPSSTAIGCG
jgi:hypothetical protein